MSISLVALGVTYWLFKRLYFGRYPSHARMWMAPIRTGIVDHKLGDYESTMDDWHHFVDETKTYYGVDMGTLTKPFSEEQRKYYLQASCILWCTLSVMIHFFEIKF